MRKRLFTFIALLVLITSISQCVHGGEDNAKGKSSAPTEIGQPNDPSIQAGLEIVVKDMDKDIMTEKDLQKKNFHELLEYVIDEIKEQVNDDSKTKEIRREVKKDNRFRVIYLKGNLVKIILGLTLEKLREILDRKKYKVKPTPITTRGRLQKTAVPVVHLPQSVIEVIQDMVFAHVKQENRFKNEKEVKNVLLKIYKQLIKEHKVGQLAKANKELERNFSDLMKKDEEMGVGSSQRATADGNENAEGLAEDKGIGGKKRKSSQTPKVMFDRYDKKARGAPRQKYSENHLQSENYFHEGMDQDS